MKTVCGFLSLLIALAFAEAVHAQSSPATTCPTDYICSLAATGASPLVGEATDGQPTSVLGFLSFDESGNITGSLEINHNGTVVTDTSITAACTSGTATTPATITATTSRGQLVIDFVASQLGSGLALLLSNHTQDSANDTPVTLGVCYPSAAG